MNTQGHLGNLQFRGSKLFDAMRDLISTSTKISGGLDDVQAFGLIPLSDGRF